MNKLEIGQQVVVYYDPLNPSKNALTEFRELGMENLGPLPLVLFGLGAAAWYIKTRRRKLKVAQVTRPLQ
jgi:hypothetical protein